MARNHAHEVKHKGEFLCLFCNSCFFSGGAEDHECNNFVAARDIGFFTSAGEWFWRHQTSGGNGRTVSLLNLQMKAMIPGIMYMFTCGTPISRWGKLNAEELAALMPEVRAPLSIWRKKLK